MTDKYIALASVLVWAAALADLAAQRDELAARRFRRLAGEIVQAAQDQHYNKLWHRIGLVQRVLAVVGVAVLVALWLVPELRQHLGEALVIIAAGSWAGGFLTAAVFDVSFNRRIGNPLFYLGSTAVTDQALAKFIPGATNHAGLVSFGAKLVCAALGVLFWILFV